jgi:hypothetical protein
VPGKNDREKERVEAALDRLSAGWRLRHYPWAGALSTAHTVYYYDRFGRDVFRKLAELFRREPKGDTLASSRVGTAVAHFSVAEAAQAADRERAIWRTLVYQRRHVSRAAYNELAAAAPTLAPHPQRYQFAAGELPMADPGPRKVLGRRPSGAANSLR